jgi:hypothetical protein
VLAAWDAACGFIHRPVAITASSRTAGVQR